MAQTSNTVRLFIDVDLRDGKTADELRELGARATLEIIGLHSWGVESARLVQLQVPDPDFNWNLTEAALDAAEDHLHGA